MKIAMWSGPRNLSTAMMYSFGNRSDFEVRDEPFYAPYLAATGFDHPLRDAILLAHETDPFKVAQSCAAGGAPHLYLKVMPHQMIDGFPVDWAEDCVNIHLIRHPARVIASYVAKREAPTMSDLGFQQQSDLFERLGGVVVDSADILKEPEPMLRCLCSTIGLPFDEAMLNWQAGPRPQDGIWARHWYGAVHRSTGFTGAEGPLPDLKGPAAALRDECLPFYERMWERRILP